MPNYWGKQIFTHGSFPEVGKKQKTERKEEREKDRTMVITMASYALWTPARVAHAKPPGPKERAKVGNNNGQLRIVNATSCGARKAAWAKKRRDWRMVITMAKLCMLHASTHGARKPPWPTIWLWSPPHHGHRQAVVYRSIKHIQPNTMLQYLVYIYTAQWETAVIFILLWFAAVSGSIQL